MSDRFRFPFRRRLLRALCELAGIERGEIAPTWALFVVFLVNPVAYVLERNRERAMLDYRLYPNVCPVCFRCTASGHAHTECVSETASGSEGCTNGAVDTARSPW